MLRIPKNPPDFGKLFDDASKSGRLPEILRQVGSQGLRDDYRHWDKLRHLSAPGDLSNHEWWLLLKLRRMGSAKPLPLDDTAGNPFVFSLADPMPAILHDIDLRAGGTLGALEPITNPETKDRYLVSSLIGEAITSSQLEGAATTRRVAKDMLRTGRPPRDHSERMIVNNYHTMKRIGRLRKETLTPELVFELHRTVTLGTLDKPDAAGRLRRGDEEIDIGDDYGQTFHVPPPADQLEARVDAMCAFANGDTPSDFLHPVVRAMTLHFWLAYDHPFVDGNGRTARALFYWCMLHHGYWLCEFISISEIIRKAPKKYGRAFLHTESDGNDLTYFLLYHIDVIRRAIDQLHDYIARKTKELRVVERRIRALDGLNHRQRALISHALRHPDQLYTIGSHRRSHKVVYQTARVDLLSLADHGLLRKGKSGREWFFSPVPDLEAVLAEFP